MILRYGGEAVQVPSLVTKKQKQEDPELEKMRKVAREVAREEIDQALVPLGRVAGGLAGILLGVALMVVEEKLDQKK